VTDSLPVLYEDRWLIAVNKPSGLLVHRSWIDKEATQFALQTVRNMTGRYVYPVHRLDKPTSGVLLFAFEKAVAVRLGEMFAEHGIQKRYLAVVRGHTAKEGVIDYPLKEVLDKMTDARAQKNKPPQSALTRYERLATVTLPVRVSRYPEARYSLLSLWPQTGRKHQLRRHMKHIFHPIVGDTKYGRGEHNRLFRRLFETHRLLLHAADLHLRHPVTGEALDVRAPLEGEMATLIKWLF